MNVKPGHKLYHSRAGAVVIAVLLMILLGLAVFAFTRPGPDASELAAAASMTVEMDKAEARDAASRAAVEKERRRLL